MPYRVLFLMLSLLVLAKPVQTMADSSPLFGLSPMGTTLRALAQLPPVWDKQLAANDSGDSCNSSRFTCVLAGEAVRDNETGLVWERSPDFANYRPWNSGLNSCANRIVGGRMGWRLPSVHELTSLVDPLATPGLRLPMGHPFLNMQSNFYWSSTGRTDDSAVAWGVNFLEGTAAGDGKPSSHLSWCVRSAGPIDSY